MLESFTQHGHLFGIQPLECLSNDSYWRVSFIPDDVEINDISSWKLVAKGFANHHAKSYEFSHFVVDAKPTALLSHGNEVSRMWHERFGNLNFKYFAATTKKLHGWRPPGHQGNHWNLQGLCCWKAPWPQVRSREGKLSYMHLGADTLWYQRSHAYHIHEWIKVSSYLYWWFF